MRAKDIPTLLSLALKIGKCVREPAFDAFKQVQTLPVQLDRIFSAPHASVNHGLPVTPRHVWCAGVVHFDDRGADCCLAFRKIDGCAVWQGRQQRNFFDSPHRLSREPVQKLVRRPSKYVVSCQIFAMVPRHEGEIFKLMFDRLPLQNGEDFFFRSLGASVSISNFYGVHDCCDRADGLDPRRPVPGFQSVPLICGQPRIEKLSKPKHDSKRTQNSHYLCNAFHGRALGCEKDIVA